MLGFEVCESVLLVNILLETGLSDISSRGGWNSRLQGLGHIGVILPDLVLFVNALLSEGYWFKEAETV